MRRIKNKEAVSLLITAPACSHSGQVLRRDPHTRRLGGSLGPLAGSQALQAGVHNQGQEGVRRTRHVGEVARVHKDQAVGKPQAGVLVEGTSGADIGHDLLVSNNSWGHTLLRTHSCCNHTVLQEQQQMPHSGHKTD